ncbi:protein NLRC5-like isoform X2 [Dysidea avara]
MLKMWLAKNTNATWKDVLAAIDSPALTKSVPLSSDIPQKDPLNAHQVISQLSDYVKTNYIKGRYYSQEGIWQLLHPKHFDNALLIHHLEGRGEREISNMTALIREGLTDSTHQLPSPDNVETESDSLVRSHNIADAFKPFEKHDGTTVTPVVIIISGAPGMGKTTLCKEMAYQWAKGQFLDNSCLMFFVYLRDPQTQKICDLQSFIHYFYNFDKAAAEFSERCANVLIKRNNEDITIILFGYDEYFDISGDQFLTDTLNRKVSCFAQSKLVVTCGPIATDKLQHVTDVKVDLLGFIEKSKNVYIQKELQGSPNKIEKLLLFLDENKEINSLCNVPMIMSILVYTFKEVDELPADQTELYEYFIALTIAQYLETGNPDFKILHLQHLPECYQQYILELSKLAFTWEDNKIVFTTEELKTLCPNLASANNKFQELGLLKSALYFNMKRTENCISYKFLHVAIQEFLATYYINSLTPSVQFDLLRKTFFVKKYADTGLMLVKKLDKSVMYNFFEYLIHGTPCEELKVKVVPKIADLDPLQAFTQLAKICTTDSSLTHSKMLCYKNSNIELYKKELSHSHSLEDHLLFIKLVALEIEWSKIYLSLCCARNSVSHSLETFVIDKSKQEGIYAKLASHLNENTLLSVVIINFASMVAYRAAKQQLVDSFDMNDSISHITLKNCEIDEETAEKMSLYFSKSCMETAAFIGCTFYNYGHKLIFNGFSSIKTLQILLFDNTNIDETTANALSLLISNNTKLFIVEITNCNLRKEAGIIVASLKNITTIMTLSLSENKIPGSIADDLAVAFYANQNVERLHLADNNLQHQGVAVASALCHIKTLVELNLSNNNMTKKVAYELSLAIESNESLQVLRIGGNDLKNDGIIRIANAISHLSQLRILAIDDNQITEEAADAIAVAISCNVHLEVLNLNNNLLKKGVAIIANALHSNNVTLETLTINNNQIPEEAADALAAAIKSNCLLEVLNLYSNNLCDGGMIKIAQSLANLSSVKHLYVGNNKITCESADALASVILANSKLETLYLDGSFLGTGVKVIANALKQISGLTSVNLYSCQIPESAAEDLAIAFLNNKSLQFVALGDNLLTTKGVQTISQALSKLSELRTYSIYNNYYTEEASDAISSVILSNSKLKYVCVGGNNLQTGVMKIENALNSVLIKELDLRHSNISEKTASNLALAVSNQYYLKEFTLEGNNLGINGILTVVKSLSTISKLTLLNLDNTSITEEACDAIALAIASNSRLEQLYLGNNKLCSGGIKVARALKKLSELRTVGFNDCSMSVQVAVELASAIATNSSLEDLRLRNNKLTTSGIITIAKSLSCLSTLRSLNIRTNQVTEKAAGDLSLLILNNTAIEELWLGDNNLQGGISKVLRALEALPRLRTLDIQNNHIPESVYNCLANFSSLRGVQNLYLESNDLCLSGVKTLIVGDLCQFTSLRVLDLGGVNMTEVMVDKLALAIPNMTLLQQLWLKNNNLGTEKVLRIAQSLSNLTAVKQLCFIGNQITEEATDAIVSAIHTNDSLEKLYLSDNDLRAGVLTIVNSLKNVSALKVLYLDNNSIPDMVFVELANIVANMNLEVLDLSFNCLQLSGKSFSKALCNINTLTSLCLNNCSMTSDCIDDLAVTIMNNVTLNSLYLAKQFKTNGVISICQALKCLSTLKNLCINSTEVDGRAAEAIASVVISNNINWLILSGCKLKNDTTKILRALQVMSSLTTLHLGHMDMPDNVVTDLVLAINNNPLLKELNICGNLVSNSLIEIVQACKASLKYLIALDIQWNSVNPSAVTELAQVTGTINTLEVLFMGGLTLNSAEKYFDNLVLYLEKSYSHLHLLDVTSVKKCQKIESLNYELQRHKISSYIKVNHETDYSLFNCTDAFVFIELYDLYLIKKHDFLSTFQKVKQILLQVDAATTIYLLPVISKLRVLDLEQSNIDEVAAFELAALLGCNSVLEQLWLGGNQLSTAGAIFILNSLVHLSALKALDLSYNSIGCQSADSVAAVIQCNPMLQYLGLDGNDLMDTGAVTVCHALKSITKLRVLNLNSNGITDDAAEAITFVISSNSCLEDLSLGNNKLKCEGICKIVMSLKNLCRLRKLDLLHNEVTKQVANELAVTISNCCTFQELYLSDNMLETEGAIKIFESLKHKSKLQVLTLSNNNITDEAVDELCLVLAQNPRLQVLLLGGNELHMDGVVRIAQAVKCESTMMRLLALCENNISEPEKGEVENIFSDNTLIHVYT